MIYVSGFFNETTPADRQREAELYDRNGWELKEQASHSARIIIDRQDIDAFCEYLHSLQPDKKLRSWTDRDGNQHDVETISLYFKGFESDRYVRLRGAFRNQEGPARFPAKPAPQPRRQAEPQQQRPPAPGGSARSMYKPQEQQQAWQASKSAEFDEVEIPF